MITDINLRRLKRLHWVRLLSFLASLGAGLFALLYIDNLLVSVVIAVVINYLTSPIVSILEVRGVTRLAAIIGVYFFFSILSTITIFIVAPLIADQFAALHAKAPEYIQGTIRLFNKFIVAFESISGGVVDLNMGPRLELWLGEQSKSFVESLPSALTASVSVGLLSPLLGFFILKDGRKFSRAILHITPNNYYELTANLLYQVSGQIGQFIRARMLEAVIVGLVTLVGLLIIGFPYAFLLSAFAALTNLIPYIGPLVGLAPPIIIALINQDSALTIALVLFVFALAQIIDIFLVIPLVVARIVDLHPVVVILVVVLGAQLLGVLGMLISIPVAASFKVIASAIYRHLTDFAT